MELDVIRFGIFMLILYRISLTKEINNWHKMAIKRETNPTRDLFCCKIESECTKNSKIRGLDKSDLTWIRDYLWHEVISQGTQLYLLKNN